LEFTVISPANGDAAGGDASAGLGHRADAREAPSRTRCRRLNRRRCESALLVVDDQHSLLCGTPEQHGLRQRPAESARVVAEWTGRGSSGQDRPHPGLAEPVEHPCRRSAEATRRQRVPRLEEELQGSAFLLVLTLGPKQCDEGPQERFPVATGGVPGTVQSDGAGRWSLRQVGTGARRRAQRERGPRGGSPGSTPCRPGGRGPAAQRRQEPVELLARSRAAEELP
jgi:hypothetical protein